MFDALDGAALLAEAQASVRHRRLAEVRDLEVLAAWADLHSRETTDPRTKRPTARWNRLVQIGGEGTPKVLDHALGEIALARGTGVTATSNALADVLDLRHRLPHTWHILRTGAAEVFVARRIARLSRHLPTACVQLVDTAIAAIIDREFAGRVITIAEAKIIEADPPSTKPASKKNADAATSDSDAPTNTACAP